MGANVHDQPGTPAMANLAAAAMLLVGVLLLTVFAIWADALRTVVPVLGRDGAPAGLFVVLTGALIGSAVLLGVVAYGEVYVATLLASAPMVPTVTAVGVLFVYLASDRGTVLESHAVYIGAGAALAVWALAVPQLRWLAAVDTAQGRSYGELVQRTESLVKRVEVLAASVGMPSATEDDPKSADAARNGAIAVAQGYLERLRWELGIGGPPQSGMRYALGTGYVNLWRAIHRAEEALMGADTAAGALAAAAYDRLRLQGSAIPNVSDLLDRITASVAQFGSASAPLFDPGSPGPTAAASVDARRTAVALLQEVRHSINVYRDDRWEGLIRARNRLLRTILLTSGATLVFILLAVLLGVDKPALVAASAFYLIGATVGLFARLRAEGTSDAAVDDYGLFEARLLHTPLLSGLAAVAGVFLFAVSPAAFGTSAAAAAAPTSLAQVFTLEDNLRGLIAAGVFGLAPELLLRWLRTQGDTIKQELSSSQATGGSPVASGEGAGSGSAGGTK